MTYRSDNQVVMKTETTYSRDELDEGTCSSCGEFSYDILDDGRCVECVEDEKFYNETMKGL